MEMEGNVVEIYENVLKIEGNIFMEEMDGKGLKQNGLWK